MNMWDVLGKVVEKLPAPSGVVADTVWLLLAVALVVAVSGR